MGSSKHSIRSDMVMEGKEISHYWRMNHFRRPQ